jgi:hypothetical protein
MSIWEEPGLLIKGHDHAPTVMMGYDDARYEAWVESWGYKTIKDLHTWSLNITEDFPPIVQRIVTSGEKNPRIRIREVNKKKFAEEAAVILSILNDAWSDNWGFVPFTPSEIAFAGKKMKPIIFNDLVMVAEYRRQAGRLHDDLARSQRDAGRSERRSVPVRLHQIAVAPERRLLGRAQGQDDARAADGRGQGAPGEPPGQPARLHDDRKHPQGVDHQI